MKKTYAQTCRERLRIVGHSTHFLPIISEDVTELVKRLETACKTLRSAASFFGDEELKQLAEELEALPEGDNV